MYASKFTCVIFLVVHTVNRFLSNGTTAALFIAQLTVVQLGPRVVIHGAGLFQAASNANRVRYVGIHSTRTPGYSS